MRNFCFLGKMDVAPITEALESNADLWNVNPDRMIGFNMVGETQFDDIWIHMPPSVAAMDRADVMADYARLSHGTMWHPAYYKLPVKPILMELFSLVDGEAFGRVFISRMKPGATIFEHRDVDLEAFTRFHVALHNKSGAVFKCGGEEAEPAVGDFFWFDNSELHSVENNSNEDRLTMVVDIVTPHRQYFFNRLFRSNS